MDINVQETYYIICKSIDLKLIKKEDTDRNACNERSIEVKRSGK